MRHVYLEPVWKLPLSYRNLTEFPPEGYDYLWVDTASDKVFSRLGRFNLAYRALNLADRALPPVLLKAWLQRFNRPPAGTDLTYSHMHPVFRPEPWIVEVEYASILLGIHPKHMRWYGGLLDRMLASPWCRKVRCWCEAGRRTLLASPAAERYAHKIDVVPHAAPPKAFTKAGGGGRVKLLFVGSGNIKGQFEAKGGLEVIEAFARLRPRYPNLELVLRSDMPAAVRARAARLPGVTVLDAVLAWERVEHEYQTADIFVLPSHSTPPFTILDAMSYELPVVTIDAWANAEIVDDGRTGLVVRRSRRVPYYFKDSPHPRYGTDPWLRAIQTPDPRVVDDLAAAVARLIDDPALRRRLGAAARHEVEHGRFSIAHRNAGLKRMFDEALASPVRAAGEDA